VCRRRSGTGGIRATAAPHHQSGRAHGGGAVLLPRARDSLSAVDGATEDTRRAANGEFGRLAISFTGSATVSHTVLERALGIVRGGLSRDRAVSRKGRRTAAAVARDGQALASSPLRSVARSASHG
jgi:hypothetical protein